jgi:hypothetical protein
MAALNLVSLVLRGVAVRCDRANVSLRLGTSYQDGPRNPEIPFSMRHPSQGYKQESFGIPADRLDPVMNVAAADSGAGRSLGLAGGVLSRSVPTTEVGRTTPTWSGANGGTVLTTASLPSLATTQAAAAGNEADSRLANVKPRLSVAGGAQPQAELCRSEVGQPWCKPATRTPPAASTWGRGTR